MSEALRAGFGEGRVRRLVARGEWTRLRRGIFVETRLLEACDPVRRHALHASAAVLALGGATVCSHESAAMLHGIPLLERVDGDLVSLTRPPGGPRRVRLHGVRIHQAGLPAWHTRRVYGVPVTSAARTVVDLARRLPFEAGVVAADGAMNSRAVDRAALMKILGECAGWRGLPRAVEVVRAADPGARSPLETLGRLMCADGGLPPPMVGEYIGEGWEPYTEADLLWRELKVIVLFDGMFKYDDPRANRNEKLVQERLENDGFTVVRLTWSDVVHHQARSLQRIRDAFTRAQALRNAR